MFDKFLETHSMQALLVPRDRRRAFPRVGERRMWEHVPAWAKREIEAWGAEALTGYPPVTATQFLAFVRTGDRKVYETPYFRRREMLIGAALALCLAPQHEDLLDAVVDGLWCICEESTWILSAHNDSTGVATEKAPLPNVEAPYIDLFAAQTAATLAYVVDIVGERLDSVSPLLRRRVCLEIEKRVFTPFFTRNDFWWMGFGDKVLINWTPWILSNVTDAMLLLMDDDARLAAGLERAMGMMDRYLGFLPEDGGLDEGVGYWNMAGGSLLDFLESLYLATDGAANFYRDPLIRAVGAFPLAAHISGRYFLNYADCDACPQLDGERVYRYGMRVNNRALAALGARMQAAQKRLRPGDTPQMNRVLLKLFEPQRDCEDAEGEQTFMSLPKLEVFAWRTGGMYASIKGGHNDESHNHNDVGSMMVYIDGEPQLVDAGNMVYTAKTFSPERYTLWNTRAGNHNIPLIGEVEQQSGRKYRAERVVGDESGASMELARAYPPEAGVAEYQRTLTIGEEAATLKDTLRLEQQKRVTWVFMLRERPVCGAGAVLSGKLKLSYPEKMAVGVERIPVQDARMARCFPGSLWRVTITDAPETAHQAVFRFERRNEEAPERA